MKVEHEIVQIMRSIGIPEMLRAQYRPLETTPALVRLAESNKISLLYLESLPEDCRKQAYVETLYRSLASQQTKFRSAITYLSENLGGNDIEYTFFKTIKPFAHTPNDIDVLLLRRGDLAKACRVLGDNGWKTLDSDSFGATLYNSRFGVNADLHLQVGVSGLIYLDKRIIMERIAEKKIGSSNVRTLDDCAELITIAAHSAYKEHLFTLNDFYSLVLLAQKVTYKELFELSRKTKTELIVSLLLNLSSWLARASFGRIDIGLNRIYEPSDKSTILSILSLGKQVTTMPHRYSGTVIMTTLLQKLSKDPNSRVSLRNAVRRSTSRSQLRVLFGHFSRGFY